MKKIAILCLALAVCGFTYSPSIAETSIDNEQIHQTAAPLQEKTCVSNQLVDQELERRGCCSWHGGVCGCSEGRALCCDGTLSPSCGCD